MEVVWKTHKITAVWSQLWVPAGLQGLHHSLGDWVEEQQNTKRGVKEFFGFIAKKLQKRTRKDGIFKKCFIVE